MFMNPLIAVLRIYFGSFIGLGNSRKRLFPNLHLMQKCSAMWHDGIFLLSSLRHRWTKLLFASVCETAPKSLFWALPVYQDLIKRHDWPVEKQLSIFQSVLGNIRNVFPVIRWVESVGGQEQRYRLCCFADLTNRVWITSATRAIL